MITYHHQTYYHYQLEGRRRRIKGDEKKEEDTRKLKSNLDLKTQVQIIEMPQTYLGRPAARTHVPGSSLV